MSGGEKAGSGRRPYTKAGHRKVHSSQQQKWGKSSNLSNQQCLALGMERERNQNSVLLFGSGSQMNGGDS